MRRSYYEIYIHAVWRTKNSEPMIDDKVIANIHNVMKAKCQKFDVQLIAIGNTEDHIHMLLSINPNIKLSEFIAEVKGATSYFVNHQTKDSLYWQDGYGAISLSKSALNTTKRYVENQKEHHKLGKDLILALENTGEG
jgi:putative transposase